MALCTGPQHVCLYSVTTVLTSRCQQLVPQSQYTRKSRSVRGLRTGMLLTSCTMVQIATLSTIRRPFDQKVFHPSAWDSYQTAGSTCSMRRLEQLVKCHNVYVKLHARLFSPEHGMSSWRNSGSREAVTVYSRASSTAHSVYRLGTVVDVVPGSGMFSNQPFLANLLKSGSGNIFTRCATFQQSTISRLFTARSNEACLVQS